MATRIREKKLIKDLTTLNHIAETLNRAVDMETALQQSLARLVELIGLESGWIFLKDSLSQNRWAGRGYRLAAYYNLPPALDIDNPQAWAGGCDCQTLCNKDRLMGAYNEVRCSRLANSGSDRRGLVIHASAPLRSGEQTLGILNVAGPSWDSFSREALYLLTNVGSLMGIALERARLFDLLQEQHIHEQAALLDFTNQLLSRHDLDDLMNYLVEEICNLLQADACAIVLPNDSPDLLAYRAAHGWHIDPVANHRLVPADTSSSSGLVMETQQPLVVEDLERYDPTTWTTDWLNVEGFRGHAVVPLIVQDNSIGVLVINTRQPRQFNEDEMRFLRLMANQAALALEKARLTYEEIKRQRMEEELSVGRQIQLSLLPDGVPVILGWEFAACYQPARLVGGDFYDFFEIPGRPEQLGIVIADVAGKGVPAALFMSLSRSIIRTKAMSGCGPALALRRANRLIAKDTRSKLFLTVCYALLDTATGQLTYARAGHNLPLWVSADDQGQPTLQELTAQGIILGAFEHIQLEEQTIQLAPGDGLIFYTDGITEAMNDRQEMFEEERLHRLLLAHQQAPAQELVTAIVTAVEQFVDETPQADDFTVVVIKREG